MTEGAKKARREYLRQWRAANKDKVKEHTARYWERQAERAQQAAAAGLQAEGITEGAADQQTAKGQPA